MHSELIFIRNNEPHSRFARLWIAWSYGGGITAAVAATENAAGTSEAGQSSGGSASPVRSDSGALVPPKGPGAPATVACLARSQVSSDRRCQT